MDAINEFQHWAGAPLVNFIHHNWMFAAVLGIAIIGWFFTPIRNNSGGSVWIDGDDGDGGDGGDAGGGGDGGGGGD